MNKENFIKENGNDLISIIIPVYNVEKYLNRCVNSVINQTYKNLEIILVDDGSTDNSGKICDDYATKDKRIKAIHKKNGGVSSARNIGLSIATGEYVGFIDADDYIEKDMYYCLFNKILNTNSQISVCPINFNGKKLEIQNFDLCMKETFFSTFNSFPCSVVNKLFNMSLIGNITFSNEISFGEDMLFAFSCFLNAKKISFLSEAKYNYNYNYLSITRKIFDTNKMSLFTAIDKIREIAIDNKLYRVNSFISKHEIYHAVGFLKQIIECDFKERNIIKILQNKVKKNILLHLFSNYKISNKLFAISVCISFSLTSIIYKLILKIKGIK